MPSKIELQRIARTLGINPYNSVNAAKLAKLMATEPLADQYLQEEAYRSFGPMLRAFRPKHFEVKKIADGKKPDTFTAEVAFYKGPKAKQGIGPALNFSMTIEAPRYDDFRGDLRYAVYGAELR